MRGRLPRAGGTDDRDEFTVLNLKIKPVDGMHELAAYLVSATNIL
jgi:hypothetical protein